MRGEAFDPHADRHPRSLSNAEVLAYLRLVPPGLEARIRRLRFLHELVRRPQSHRQVIAALVAA
eukprot:3951198-Pyramimonas_sp.AAC.1